MLSLDDCRQFSITMYLKISRRLHGHWNYKGYLKARSIAPTSLRCFLKETIVRSSFLVLPRAYRRETYIFRVLLVQVNCRESNLARNTRFTGTLYLKKKNKKSTRQII